MFLPPARFALFWIVMALATEVAPAAPPALVRVATYNVSFFRTTSGALALEMANPNGTGTNFTNIRKVAEVLQRLRPDVILLNEFDFDAAGQALDLFHANFLAVPMQAELAPLDYPYRYSAPSNTGISSGFDLDNNGVAVTNPGTEAYGNDSFGFGTFSGQYGMAVLSRFPFHPDAIRRFQLFKWKDLPDSQLLLNEGSPPLTSWYSAAEREVLRLSSKTHLDVPVDLGGGIILHLLASHPTPPTFDGPENRNGKRNFDEIRFWADYVDPSRSSVIYDDGGITGGLPTGARFVIAGDLNADPNDGDSVSGAARQLTMHPAVNATFIPSSGAAGGGAAYSSGAGQTGNPIHDTAAFSGGLRVDYVLPSRAGFSVFNGAVFWPGPADPLKALVGDMVPSDHHAVYLDLRPVVSLTEAVQDLQAAWNGANIILTWQAAPGYSYSVQQSSSPGEASWTSSGAVPVINPETFAAEAVLPASGALPARNFFRLEVRFTP